MSFLNEDKGVEQVSVTDSKNGKNKAEKKGNSVFSLILLVLILVALYYGKDYLTGEKEIPVLSDALPQTKPESNSEPKGRLIVPKENDRSLKSLLTEFKKEYEQMYGPLKMKETKPEVKMIQFSEDKKSLLIELESSLPASGAQQSEDIIYNMDEFGRLVTKGTFSLIKLHPKN